MLWMHRSGSYCRGSGGGGGRGDWEIELKSEVKWMLEDEMVAAYAPHLTRQLRWSKRKGMARTMGGE